MYLVGGREGGPGSAGNPAGFPRITPALLAQGWPGPDGSWLRLVQAGEAAQVERLFGAAGIPLTPDLAAHIDAGDVATTSLQGLVGGPDRLLGLLAEALAAGDPTSVLPGLVTVLVAVERTGELTGALLAAPPSSALAAAAADGVELERVMYAAVTVTNVQAVAVDARARGRGLGTALLRRCAQLHHQLGFYLMYGQFRSDSGLDAYYSRRAFEVLPEGDGIPLARLGLPIRIGADIGERLFLRWRRVPVQLAQ